MKAKYKSLFRLTLTTFAVLGTRVHATEFQIRLTNLTRGQPLTPPIAITHHSQDFKIFDLGRPATEGLWRLAEGGERGPLQTEISDNPAVDSVVNGAEVILPGQSVEVRIPIRRGYRAYLSLASMLARTNDGFSGANSIPLPEAYMGKTTVYLPAYDAGTERNNESCAFIPAPPCNSPGQRDTEGAEGFVHPHPGVRGGHDLDSLRDIFAGPVLKVEILRVH